MRNDWTVRRQTSASAARAETIEECGGSILYLDEQQLTRDCVGRELARRLPEFKITERATARDLTSGDNLQKLALVILYVHADRMNFHDNAPEQSGIAAQLSVLEEIAPEIPRVLMSEVEVPEDILEAFRRRVRGYVPTTLPMKQVAEAIRFVAAGGTFVPPSILSLHGRLNLAQEEPRSLLVPTELVDFSPRQNEVLRMLWNGNSNKLIAYELRMSESTVKVHIRHIMRKLNVNNRTQVVLRTRPQRLEREFQASPTALLPTLSATRTVPSISNGSETFGQTTGRPLKLAREIDVHGNSHRD